MSLSGLRQPLPLDDALTLIGEGSLSEERLQHRVLRLLELEEERILVVPAQQQDDPRLRTHAADSDDLARDVRIAEALQQLPAVDLDRASVRLEDVLQRLGQSPATARREELLNRDDQRRVADDASLAVDDLGQLGERPEIVLHPLLGEVAFDPVETLRAHFPGPLLHDRLHLQPCVPDVERALLREIQHRKAVRVRGSDVDGSPLLRAEPALAAGNGEARDQTLDVPLERPGQRLVEVVQAEHETPVRGRVHAEVRQVCIARQLDGQAGPWRRREIRRHHARRPAEERERREKHAPVPDRHQLRDARSRLLLEQLDRIRPIRRGRPVGVRRAPRLGPRGLPASSPFGGGRMLGLSQARPGAATCSRPSTATGEVGPAWPASLHCAAG